NLVRFRTKIRLLEKIGIDILFLLPFSVNFSKFSGRYFIENILIKNIKVNNVLVGEDFKFGKNREGDISLLKEYADNNKFNLKFYTKKGYKGKDYSSSSIRNLINLGKLDEAYISLGYFWEVEGKVIKGNAKGRELGFPTANLSYIYQISPSNGIYAGWVQVEGEKIWRQAAISTGRRPHYNGVKLVLEVHILFFSGNLYQKRLRVAFVQKIRGEQKFDSEEGLINQMKNDCQNIKNILKKKYITNDNTGHDAGP
ncbi:MAG: riboflavin kinase, partial [Pseudomonadota bacterium]|nr:riboflavin kinase [Pseudomonadota bacterium]